MLELDSPRWAELTHIYGSAEEIPSLLRELLTAPTAPREAEVEPWHSLGVLLCDFGYGPVSTASYAAVPHLVANAATRPPEERGDLIYLVASIEALRHYGDAPPIPADFDDGYFASLEHMRLLIYECLKVRLEDENRARLLLGGMAVVSGFPKYGNAMMHLSRNGEVCHECGARVPVCGYFPNRDGNE